MLGCAALRLAFASALVTLLLLGSACEKKSTDDGAPRASSEAATSVPTASVPPVLLSSTPVNAFADASLIDGKTPYEQARAYEANGQHWLARLVLEQKALGPSGSAEEVELLGAICHEQGDETCLEACSSKLGRKLAFDARAGRAPLAPGEHKEPDSDAARARDLLLRNRPAEARKLLEAKVLDGKASKEEVRLLRTVCKEQADRMCIALCDAKLK